MYVEIESGAKGSGRKTGMGEEIDDVYGVIEATWCANWAVNSAFIEGEESGAGLMMVP